MWRHTKFGFKAVIVVLLASFIVALIQPQRAAAADDKWRARYWNNLELEGEPVLTRDEAEINHDWGDGAPGDRVDKDNFSARWTRTIYFPTGTWRFSATTDDGMRVYVNDALVIDSWTDSQVHTVTGDIFLSAGEYRVKVEYYEAGGKAVAKLNYRQVGGVPPVTSQRWRGEYYNNSLLMGAPVLIREDFRIDFDWGLGSPGPNIPHDRFSVRWTRNVPLEAGRYRFTVRSDDGVRLWVNGQLIIDEWHDAQAVTYIADIDVPGGNIPIRLEYFEHQGAALVELQRTLLSGVNRWRGEYFNNRFLSGAPALIREDANINFDWGTGRPDPAIAADNFSVRWTRSINFAPGRYRFTATSDDGVRIFVNGQLLLDSWYDHPPRTSTAEITLSGGPTPVVVEYYEHTGGALIQVTWSQVGGGAAPPPSADVPQAEVVRARYLAVRATPEMADNIITAVEGGTIVTMLGRNGGWIKVRLPSGTVGWVGGSYLRTNYPITSLPFLTQ